MDDFVIEFISNKFTKKEINKRYSENRNILQSIILYKDEKELQTILENRNINIKPLCNKIQVLSPKPLIFLSSLILISINRIFRNN